MKFLKTSLFFILSTIVFSSCEELILPSNTSQLQGTWKCEETHEEEGSSTYNVEIDIDESDSSIVYFYNFLNLENSPSVPVSLKARVSGNRITINSQNIAGHQVEGSGTINSTYSKITLNFLDDVYGGTPWNVSATLTKQ